MLPLKSYLPVLAALLAIFFSGYGVGYLLGKKEGRDSASITFTIPQEQQTGQWQEGTLEQLSQTLNLNSHQKKLIAAELENSAILFSETYKHTLRSISRQQLELMDRIIPHLTQKQKEELKKLRKSMEEQVDSRFPE